MAFVLAMPPQAVVSWQPWFPSGSQLLAALAAAAAAAAPPSPPRARPLPPTPAAPAGQPLAAEVTRTDPPQQKRTDLGYRRFQRVPEKPESWWESMAELYEEVMEQRATFCFHVRWETYHGWAGTQDASLVVHMHRRAVQARHAMQRMIEPRALDLNAPFLLRELPAVGGTGEPIRYADFVGVWDSNVSQLLLHLIRKHEGESREVYGDWEWRPGKVPTHEEDPYMHHAQFCKHRSQYLETLGKGAAGKGQTEHPPGWQQQPAVGGKGRDGDGDQPVPALGGKVNRVLYGTHGADEADGFWFRTAYVYTLPQLLLSFSTRFSARDLYSFYMHSRVFTVKRPHAWTSESRREATLRRFADTGRYGWGRG